MNRRQLFPAIAGALVCTALPYSAISAEISPKAEEAVGLRCSKCFAPAHFHRIDRTKLGDAGWIEHWMTPKGEVYITRWASMDDPETISHVEGAMEQIYGPI